jgi:hypothetical protein
MEHFVGKTKEHNYNGTKWRTNTRKLIGVTAQLRKIKIPTECVRIHSVYKNTKNGVFFSTVISISTLGVHRSLFHPLATVRHRI